MSELRKTVGARVRELRRMTGLTQEALGERAGLSYKFIGEIERGVANPTLDTLGNLAKALGADLRELMPGSTSYGSEFSAKDYSLVREAREAIDVVLHRFQPRRSRRPKD